MTASRLGVNVSIRGHHAVARLMLLAVVAGAGLGAACAAVLAAEAPGGAKKASARIAPARVEATADAKIKKITLTPKAAERLGVQIDEVREDPSGRRIVPYAAVFYDLTGKTWVYVNAEPLTFVRGAVKIDTIKGDNVYLSDGPPSGTKVLAAGVAQVFGVEAGVGH
jgi:hypothetical protein